MSKPALLIIDMQRGMSVPAAGERNNKGAEETIAQLLAVWRKAGAPVVHIRHVSQMPGSPFWPGQPGAEFQPALAPQQSEHIVVKKVPDAFVNTGLERWLRSRNISTLVLVGVSTNIAVESTARSAGNLGFRTQVVSDATFAFARTDHAGVPRSAAEVHAMSLANLQHEFAEIVSSAALLSLA